MTKPQEDLVKILDTDHTFIDDSKTAAMMTVVQKVRGRLHCDLCGQYRFASYTNLSLLLSAILVILRFVCCQNGSTQPSYYAGSRVRLKHNMTSKTCRGKPSKPGQLLNNCLLHAPLLHKLDVYAYKGTDTRVVLNAVSL